MKIHRLHDWNLSYQEAVQVQKKLVKKLKLSPLKKKAYLVAGADISFSKKDPTLYAGVVVMRLPTLEIVETSTIKGRTSFPYIPGLLAFREIPVLLKAFQKLKNVPDVIMCDGQGIAHPRGLGLASHLGLILKTPTIGCAKTRLVGDYKKPARRQGAQKRLLYKGRRVGCVFRSQKNVKPLFISPGHLIDFSDSVKVIRQCMSHYRLPEPTRRAHGLVNAYRQSG